MSTKIGNAGVTFPDSTVQSTFAKTIPTMEVITGYIIWNVPPGITRVKVIVTGGGGSYNGTSGGASSATYLGSSITATGGSAAYTGGSASGGTINLSGGNGYAYATAASGGASYWGGGGQGDSSGTYGAGSGGGGFYAGGGGAGGTAIGFFTVSYGNTITIVVGSAGSGATSPAGPGVVILEY